MVLSMSIIRQFVKSIGVIGTPNAAIALKGLILIPIIVKLLGEEDFGIWAQLLVTLYLMIPFATLHLGIAYVRFNSAETDRKKLSRNALGLFVDLSDFIKYFPILTLILPLWSVNLILYSYFRTTQQFNKYAVFTITHNLIDVALIGLFIVWGWGLLGALYGHMLNFGFISLIMFAVIYSQIGLSRPDFSVISKYIAFSLPLVPLELFWWVADSSDKYITGFYLGAAAVGVYAAVYGLSRIVNMFVQPLNFVLGPKLAKLYDNGMIDEVKKLLSFSIKMFMMFALPLVVGFTILSRPMLLVLATEEVSSKGTALVPLITLGMLFYGYGTIYGQIINLVKKTQVAGAIWGGAALINIVLNFMLIPMVGIIGPAVSTLVTFGFATIVIVIYTTKFIIIPVDWRFISKSVVAAFAMGGILYFLLPYMPYNMIATIILIVTGVGAYFGLLVAFRAFGKQEKEFFSNLLVKKR